jgi:two-component system chemotaxis response regulator CheB
VVTLDVEMPGLDGLGALDRMLESRPVAVVMLSAHTGTGMSMAVMALERGAVDCVGKPSGSVSLDLNKVQGELVEKVRNAARVPRSLIRPHPPSVTAPRPRKRGPEDLPKKGTQPASFAVAVASSTGGPRALHEFLTHMPSAPTVSFSSTHGVGFARTLPVV